MSLLHARITLLFAVGLLSPYVLAQATHDDAVESTEELQTRCNSNDFRSCSALGDHYKDVDTTDAIALFDLACRRKDAAACCNLAARYATGTGVAKNKGRSAELYRACCDAGDPVGCRATPKQTSTANSTIEKLVTLPTDIDCNLRDAQTTFTFDSKGVPKGDLTAVKAVQCQFHGLVRGPQRDIPLLDTSVVHGIVVTRDFGGLMFVMKSGENPGSLVVDRIAIQDSNRKAFETYLNVHRQQAQYLVRLGDTRNRASSRVAGLEQALASALRNHIKNRRTILFVEDKSPPTEMRGKPLLTLDAVIAQFSERADAGGDGRFGTMIGIGVLKDGKLKETFTGGSEMSFSGGLESREDKLARHRREVLDHAVESALSDLEAHLDEALK